jgi:hypothetical protein
MDYSAAHAGLVVFEKIGGSMKQLFNKNFLWLVPLALAVAGCKPQPMAIVPPTVHYGLETCADCGMILNDYHYASAIAFRAPADDRVQTKVFDDIGCLLAWRRNHTKIRVAATWVKDVKTAVWLDAASAVYVKSDKLSTPMGSGIAAGTVRSDFANLPIRQPVLTWSNLVNADSIQTGRMAMSQP